MKTISTARGGGSGTPYNGLYGGDIPRQEGYGPIHALVSKYMKGQRFISLSVWKTMEICPFGQ